MQEILLGCIQTGHFCRTVSRLLFFWTWYRCYDYDNRCFIYHKLLFFSQWKCI